MKYEEWEKTVNINITEDSLWKNHAYRLALFIGDIGWFDVSKLIKDRRTLSTADQLYRSLGSISANISEGYSRGTSRERAHFYEYALGSARESRDWYHKSQHILGEEVVSHRVALITEIIRLLLTIIPQQRGSQIREGLPEYKSFLSEEGFSDNLALKIYLQEIPLPWSKFFDVQNPGKLDLSSQTRLRLPRIPNLSSYVSRFTFHSW